MELLSRIKYFILDLDVFLGKSFFFSQSRASYIVKDIFFSKILLLKKDFPYIKGSLEVHNLEIDQKKLAKKNRSNSLTAQFSSGYEFDEIPNEINMIIEKYEKEISSYLGKGFLYEKAQVFRNYAMPKELTNFDVYSNVWHQDSGDGNRLLKIFFLVHDVNKNHGPFLFLEFKNVKKHWIRLRERWDFAKIKGLPSFKEEVDLTGKKGDYLIIDTSKCMHRASIPVNYRDIVQITLYPRWRNGAGRKALLKTSG